MWFVDNVDLSNFPEGEINLEISLGTVFSIPRMTIIKDTRVPNFGLNSIDDYLTGNSLQISGTCSEIGTVNVSVGNFLVDKEVTCREGEWSLNINFSDREDGTFRITTSFSDLAGNSANQRPTANITKDTEYPTVEDLEFISDRWMWGCSEIDCTYRYVINTSGATHTFSAENFTESFFSNPQEIQGNNTYRIFVQAKDAAGNESTVVTDTFVNVLIAVRDVTITPGSYNAGDNLDIVVEFTEGAVVEGTPRIYLEIGSGDPIRYATYYDGTNSDRLIFRYTIQEEDMEDSEGITLGNNGNIDLNGGIIRSMIDVEDAQLAFSQTSLNDVFIDLTSPEVAITSDHSDEINTSNAVNYRVAGTCEAGLEVEVRVEDIAPESSPTCQSDGSWQTFLNIGNLDEGATLSITASQTDAAGNTGEASAVSATVGTFTYIVSPLKKIDGGVFHTCVVKYDGTVSCWGAEYVSEALGSGDGEYSGYPVDVLDSTGTTGSTLSSVVQVSAGGQHTCAVKANGELYCWGEGIVANWGFALLNTKVTLFESMELMILDL